MDYETLVEEEDPPVPDITPSPADVRVATPVIEQQPETVTTVVTYTNPIFGPKPALAYCNYCKHTGYTVIDSEPGSMAFYIGCLLCTIG